MKEFFLKVSLQKENVGQLLLGIIFVLYLVMGLKTPESVANMVDTVIGKMVLFLVVIYMFMNMHPVLAVLSLLVAFDLMRRSASSTGIDALKKYAPSEEKKMSQFTAFNQFPYTLEQEVVSKMAPIVHTGGFLNPPTYKPTLDDLHDASSI